VALTIALLGAPRIAIDGEPLRVDTRKAVALLAYLAVTGHGHSRERLTALFWPDSDPDRARAAFRRTISTLKTALGGDRLVVDRAVVALATGDVELDLARFRELAAPADGKDAASARLREAVELHRDDLLAGFALRDSPEFDGWQAATAAELRRELAVALDRLVAALAAEASYDEATAYARRRLSLDLLDEPAHRSLIELLAATGKRAEALRQYRECVRILDRELGVRPLPETTELYQAVNEGRLVRRTAAPSLVQAHPPRMLVGREREWQRLIAAFADAAGEGRVVTLEGEPGIGKTRLGDELVAHARSQGAIAVAVRSHVGEESLPYGLVADTVRAALAERATDEPLEVDPRARAEAARLVPELCGATHPASVRGPGARQRFYEGLAQVLVSSLSGALPGVVFLDDLQWADSSSLDVFAYVAQRLAAHPLLLVAAWRSGDLARPRGRPWLGAERLALGRLSRDDVGELAHAAGGDETLTDALFRESEGLPLFVVEYLAVARPEGGAAPMPLGVRELLRSRLATVSEGAGQLLAAAAVIGGSVEVETLRDTSGRSDEEVVSGLEELSERGLLVEQADGYDFTHDKLRELVRDQTSLARSRLLHRRAAEARASRGGDAAIVAYHHREAGHAREAAIAYCAAAERALSLYAYAESLDHFRAALALGHPEPATLHEAIGDIHTTRGEYRAALAAYETAAALGDGRRLAEIEHKLGRVHDRRGTWDLAERHFEVALELGGEQPRVYADRSIAARHRGAEDAAIAFAQRALELAERSDDREALAQAHNMVGMLRHDRAHLERSLALAETLPDPTITVAALNNLALACARAGDGVRALELTERAFTLCSRQGDRHREAALHNNLADLLHRAGRSDEAMAQLKLAAALFAEIGGDAGEMQPEVWMLVEW
jgi:DNA-binding SARP family transcriptional activator/predicted ATPase